jgi:hypothetical protein
MTQYIPTKSHKFGIKLWVLVEAVSGYIIHFFPYRGRRYDTVPNGEMQGTHVVMKLLRESDLLEKWHHVFCDNFFTSLILARSLLTANTYLTGTIRKNRNLPRLISEANPGANQAVFSRSGCLLCCAFKERQNRKTVRFVSTYMNAVHNQNEKPSIATTYNKFMGGVDRNDMLSGVYDDHRKSKAMWKRIAINILHRMLLNAYILYRRNTDDDQLLSRADFIASVIEALSNEHLVNQPPLERRENREDAFRDGGVLERLEGKREKNCIVCSTNDRRKRSRTICGRCRKGIHPVCLRNYDHRCRAEQYMFNHESNKFKESIYIFFIYWRS